MGVFFLTGLALLVDVPNFLDSFLPRTQLDRRMYSAIHDSSEIATDNRTTRNDRNPSMTGVVFAPVGK